MVAERHGIAQRSDEVLAMGTGTQVMAYFAANIGRQLVIDEGRQLAKNLEAFALSMLMTTCDRTSGLPGDAGLRHGVPPSARPVHHPSGDRYPLYRAR